MGEDKNSIMCLNGKLPSVKGNGTMKAYHETLLIIAKNAFDREEYELSVILATSACEILTETAFRLLFGYRKIDYLYLAR